VSSCIIPSFLKPLSDIQETMLQGIDGALQSADGLVGRFIDGKDPKFSDNNTVDAMAMMSSLQEFQVKEKMSAIEALSAFAGAGQEFEMANKYTIVDNSGKTIFFGVEGTDMCTRQLKGCCGDCAPWNLDLRVVNENNEAERAFTLTRPWTFTCCCFNRPTVSVQDMQGNELALMRDPCACCDLTFTIQDPETGDDELYIKGGCCQMGLCCPLPFGPCSEVHFSAEDPNGQEVGSITKKVPSCLKFLASPDVDNYEVDVSGIEDPKMKLAMMAVSIFIDFRYFNENANAEDSDGDGIPDRFDFSDSD